MAAHWLLLPPRYGLSLLVRQRLTAPSDTGEQGGMAMGLIFCQEHRPLAHCHVDMGGQASPNDRGCVQGGDMEGPPRYSGEHATLGLGQVAQAQPATVGSQGRGGCVGPGVVFQI
jgi:hypothetical protein